MDAKALIESGKTALGIELGSTRIKGVLIDLKGRVLAVGIHDWENSFVDNIWTYSLEDIHAGIRNCYTSLRKEVEKTYGVTLKTTGAIGISAMMHGYMALNADGEQIAPFQGFFVKGGMGLTSFVIGAFLKNGGYVANAVQTDKALSYIEVCFIWIPVVLCVIIAVLTWFYKLDSLRSEMTEELESRRRKIANGNERCDF